MPREYVFILGSGEREVHPADSIAHADCIARSLQSKAHMTAAAFDAMPHDEMCLLLETISA